MNAKQAKVAARNRATEIKNQHEAAERKRREEASAKWLEEQANWYKNYISRIERAIEQAVDKGEDKAEVCLATSDKPEQAKEQALYERGFAFKPELKKVIAHFKSLGYRVAFNVRRAEHVDLSDLNPGDNWFTYETQLEISW